MLTQLYTPALSFSGKLLGEESEGKQALVGAMSSSPQFLQRFSLWMSQ